MRVQQQVGEKIRMYRKLKKISLEEMATQIHKSKSILSKYELGESVFDMDTMYRIAEVLDIEPAQLLEPKMPGAVRNAERYGIFQNNTLYVYMLVRDRGYHLLKSMIRFNGDTNNTLNLYMQVPDFEYYIQCKVLYTGRLICHPSNAFINLTNQADTTDHAVLSAAVRMGNPDVCLGMTMMSGYSTHDPGALKTLISKKPVVNEDELISFLTINKDDISSTKRSNIFSYKLGSIDRELFL